MCDVLLLRASTRVDLRGTVRDTRVTSCFRGGWWPSVQPPAPCPRHLARGCVLSVCVQCVCVHIRGVRATCGSLGELRVVPPGGRFLFFPEASAANDVVVVAFDESSSRQPKSQPLPPCSQTRPLPLPPPRPLLPLPSEPQPPSLLRTA